MNEQPVAVHPRCVDCGYDLHGLGEAARCPECGRVNVPEAYRREVWELVDRGTFFFSNPFQLFRKRPPGWWWSLDRPGDVRRSVRRLVFYLLLSTTILVSAVVLADSFHCEMKSEYRYPSIASPRHTTVVTMTSRIGCMGVGTDSRSTEVDVPNGFPVGPTPPVTSISFDCDGHVSYVGVFLGLIVLGTWLCPSFVGLWTQVRKGLPGFARAFSTVVSACNLEAHRLIYTSVVCAIVVTADLLVRLWQGATLFTGPNPLLTTYGSVSLLTATTLIMLYGALGWIGALRSDFTRQIIRSRWHAWRIVWMYGVLLCPVFAALGLAVLSLVL